MGAAAASFQLTTPSPLRAAEAFAHAAASVTRPTAGLVFASGALATRLTELAEAVRDTHPHLPVVLAAGSGVLSERGEVEDQAAVSGVIWTGGRVEPCLIEGAEPEQFGEALAQTLADRTGKTLPTVVLFANKEQFGASAFQTLRETRSTPYILGGGTVGTPGSILISDGAVRPGNVALVVRGLSPPSIRTTHSCRLLGPLLTITEARGAMVLALDGRPALEVLGELGSDLPDRPVILTVLAEPEGAGPLHGGRPELVVRGVQGIDPSRGGLVVTDEVKEGMRLTFAVRDPRAAREDLEAVSRELARDIAGAAPRFGLYFNCSGRGSGLYGAFDVDTRIIRSRFGAVPLAGMQTSFEIAPHAGSPTLQLYSGVLGLFTSPS